VLALAFVPVLFRLYTPQDFGVWAAVQAIAIIAGSLVSLRFDLALVLERDLAAATPIFSGLPHPAPAALQWRIQRPQKITIGEMQLTCLCKVLC